MSTQVNISTDFQREYEEQQRWKLLPAAARFSDFYADLLENEFRPPEELESRISAMLRRTLQHTANTVPWYRAWSERSGVELTTLGSRDDLPALPVLSKHDLTEAGESLLATSIPSGNKRFGWFASSGTTGKPARVMHCSRSNGMFSLLVQRQHRWFRYDPMLRMATIRIASQNGRREDGSLLPMGESLEASAWRYSGQFFQTGPQAYFNVENPVEVQLEWLKAIRPAYLQSYSESLEHLAFACDGKWPVPEIQKVAAISEQLTPSMRSHIERTMSVSVVQSYGLNEIGLVAIRCEAGRYHWHVEHCIVEILDQDGNPCLPGQRGRIVVTALRNFAMPLLRYDTGDIAEAVIGPCGCGRTLPAFGEISGRYSRIAFLPEATLMKVGGIRTILEEMPADIARNLRQFQVHQTRDGNFELRLLSAGPLNPLFHPLVRQHWEVVQKQAAQSLSIVEVSSISRSPGGKFQDFTSDFMPMPDESVTGESAGESVQN
jgi:phenylacetate-CoA ligase